MASTYVNDLRLNEMATGDASGTWGTVTNTNLELIAEAFSYGSEAIANASTHTITVADGASDEARSFYLKCTGGGQACTVTLAPNNLSKVWLIENATAATLTFTQGSGANVAVSAGQVKMIATDGGGSGGIVYDLFTDLELAGNVTAATSVTSPLIEGTTSIQTPLIEFTDGDDAITIANGGATTFAQTATFSDDIIIGDGKTIGSASDVDAMTIAANGQVTFTQTLIGTALDISGDIDVDGTTNLDVVDIDGAVDMASTLGVTGVVTANAGVVVDNFTLDGTTLALSSGDMTLDVAGDIILDADGGVVYLNDGGVGFGQLVKNSNDFRIFNPISDGDIVFRGNDNGSVISALTLDMSAAGAATFNSTIASADITITSTNRDSLKVLRNSSNGDAGIQFANTSGNLTTAIAGALGDFTIDTAGDISLDADGANVYFNDGGTERYRFKLDATPEINVTGGTFTLKNNTSDADILFTGNDGGSAVTALTLDMSAAGAATFNAGAIINGTTQIKSGNELQLLRADNGTAVDFSNDGSGVGLVIDDNNGDGFNVDFNGTRAFRIAGDGSLSTPTAGTSNVRFGVNAGNSIASGGIDNTVVGDEAGTAITTGRFNTLIGKEAGDALNDADSNVAIGKGALSSDTQGSQSTAIGTLTLTAQNFTSATDAYNVAVGAEAGKAITTATRSVLIGGLAGDALDTGTRNVVIGYNALGVDTKGNKAVAIGYGALQTQNLTSDTDTFNVGRYI